MSQLEDLLAQQIELARAAGLPIPEPEREYRFCPPRRWRADFWFGGVLLGTDQHSGDLAVEVEGGVLNQGRHQRPKGFSDDIAKYNEMAFMGIMLIRCTGEQVHSGEALRMIQRAFGRGEGE